ncbi:MAG: tRNA (adenosine(37)-N6)-dimethylallyltransferase MiaA [Cytophagales bacterium]
MPKLIAIVGPTAVGKTKYAVDLALQKACPIISADSRQFYKEISIGTAKPDANEMKGVPHHFINSHSVHETFTAGDFEKEGILLLEKLFQNHDEVILVGGSGMYVNALCMGLDEMPQGNEEIRTQLQQLFHEKGITILQEKLKHLDPDFFEICEQKNPQRLMRAIEICLVTGKTNLEIRNGNVPKKRFFEIQFIGLEMPRNLLNLKIEARVDEMIDNGLVNEVKSMLSFRNHYALKTVGYREIFSYLDGEISLDQAIELIKKNTKDYAKKQMTWFKKNEKVNWISA